MGSKLADLMRHRHAEAFDVDGKPLRGSELYEVARQLGGDKILLSFSAGKDSLAIWLALRDYFEITPFYMYWVPGLEFEAIALDYYERFFGCHIYRIPHPIFYNFLRNYIYQPPERVPIIRATLEHFEYEMVDADRFIAQQAGLIDPFVAMGLRVNDNFMRRAFIERIGALGWTKRRFFYPVWDWTMKQVTDIILEHKVKLSPLYWSIGRTIIDFRYQYLKPIRRDFPEDFQKILEWFPLLEAEFTRYEANH